MKEQIGKLLRWITGSKKRAAVFSVVCVVLLALLLALIVRIASPKSPTEEQTDSMVASEPENGYVREASCFEDSSYPAHFSMEGAGIRAELDGSATPELKWEIRCEPEDTVSIEYDGEETEGHLSFLIRPLMTGYADLTCERTMQIGEQNYAVTTIRLSFVVSENPYGSLETEMVEAQQIPAELGAADTEYPYLLTGNRIYFPNGGDWIVSAEDSAGGFYQLFEGGDTVEESYVQLMTQPQVLESMDETEMEQAIEAGIILESESLGIRQRLRVVYDEDGQITLAAAEEE